MSARNKPTRSAAPAEMLPKAAGRLLAALSETDVVARPDPSREDFVMLCGYRAGVSIGRGSHARDTLVELARRELVTPVDGGRAFAISTSGRARLRREKGRRDGAPQDAFALQHRELDRAVVASETGESEVSINARESPLAWLRRRRGSDGEPLIDAAAFEAGERLRRDITLAGFLPSVSARWDGAVGGSRAAPRDPAGATDTVIAARQRVRAALAAIGGDLADLLLDLCGFLKGVETIERERRWPQRSGKIVIRLALGQLARHYGLSNEASGSGRSRRIRTWIAPRDAA